MNLLYIGVCKENLKQYYPAYIPGVFLDKDFTEEELLTLVHEQDIDVLMVDVIPLRFTKALLQRLQGRIRQINFLYQSITSLIDVEAAQECGIKITKLPDEVYCNEVAEFSMTQLLCACKGILQYDRSMRHGEWNQAANTNRSLQGKTLGIVGFGNIGQRIAELSQNWGMKILVTKRDLTSHPSILNITWVEFNELLRQSDFVIFALPLCPTTYRMLNADNIDLLKDGAIVINVSRGDIVDEEAISAALSTGKLGTYCSDVFSREPLGQDHPFAASEHTILSPHVAWVTEETLRRSFQLWSEQVNPEMDSIAPPSRAVLLPSKIR
ncbi:MAG: D-isomer specific 2-hydroxyacid dehydrogenase family protein [Candidatus Thiodiazotropha sp.]|jgi:phosphoglycerate dehydrogenase-like enzyme